MEWRGSWKAGHTCWFVLSLSLDGALSCLDSDPLQRRLWDRLLLRHALGIRQEARNAAPANSTSADNQTAANADARHRPLSAYLPTNSQLLHSSSMSRFQDSPDARSKSITTADLDTHGVSRFSSPPSPILN